MKLAMYLLKRCWIIIICAAIGFGYMYWRASDHRDTYTSSGTMIVENNNPNTRNIGYYSASDSYSAQELIKLYTELVKTESVSDRIAEYLLRDGSGWPEEFAVPTGSYVASTISMSAVNETQIVRVYCRTDNPKKSFAICNAILHVAPATLGEQFGSCTALDFPKNPPTAPDYYSPRGQALRGALYGGALAAAVLAVIFLFNRKIQDTKDLTDNYQPPVLASVKRDKHENDDPGSFLLSSKSEMNIAESYSKLRMNLFYTLVEKQNNAVVVTSAISGEGKSTITANLAISCAMSGKKVLLVDADMRRACQRDIFHYKRKQAGLSNVLAGNCSWKDTIINAKQHEELDIMPAGQQPPNPAELLSSHHMRELLKELNQHYDLVLLDAPPINIVSDPLALSDFTAGSLFVVRQNFSDHGEIRKALSSAELTGMNILGFIFYGEKLEQSSYYSRKYYKGYYHKYDTRAQSTPTMNNKRSNEEAPRRTKDNENAKDDNAFAADDVDHGSDADSESGDESRA